MRRWAAGITRKNEFYVFLTILVLCIVIEIRSGQFFTSNNIVDIIAATIVPGMFALGTFIVIVTGGIDVSFPALATLTTYLTTKVLADANYTGPVILPLIMVAALGAICGALNGFLIARFCFPALLVTLGTSSIFSGLSQGALASRVLSVIPPSMETLGEGGLFTVYNEASGLTAKMPGTLLFLIAAIIAIGFLLRRTIFGRGIYAIGGSETSAERAGFNTFRTKFLVYVIAGVIASIAGFIRTCMIIQFQPTNLIGMEMMVIASVVLGGASITGGYGTITGAMLGTLLIVLVQNSMILAGVSTFWQAFSLGALILIGTGISAVQGTLSGRKLVGLKDAEGGSGK